MNPNGTEAEPRREKSDLAGAAAPNVKRRRVKYTREPSTLKQELEVNKCAYR
jgi:hypothetical protein